MISFERIDICDIGRGTINHFNDVNIFQTLPWINFVAKTQNAEPVVAAVRYDNSIAGYFIGLIVKKYGIKILGSPFRGWTTYFMGFNLSADVSRREVFKALPKFAFLDLGCHYLEIVDANLAINECEGLTYDIEHLNWKKIDLTKSEDQLWANMKHNGRNCIRKALKSGVVIEETNDNGFVKEYFGQYEDVLSKKSMMPAYRIELVQQLVDYLLPTGKLILLRAINKQGLCIATGIFLHLNKSAIFWGAASLREHQILRPNDLLAWYGIKKMKACGMKELHFGGQAEQYKEKLGCADVVLPRLMKAKYSALSNVLEVMRSQRSIRFKNWILRRL
jgi:hypothetical protein